MARRPHVTDHALLRYLERVYGFNIDAYRREVEATVAQAVELGACGLVRNGFRYAMDEHRVVTIHPASDDPRFPHHAFSGRGGDNE